MQADAGGLGLSDGAGGGPRQVPRMTSAAERLAEQLAGTPVVVMDTAAAAEKTQLVSAEHVRIAATELV